ncbi:prepilin-type N-terminal cleavage/methylation domain-containing protein [Candidatus Parcubacteria bacterium]|nr:prepilin-type N-terminal cleavage/methylation domain-containing protein [Candidatus Parcubacteria bacterium]
MKKRSGLTLIEVVVSISIFVVTIIVISSLFIYHSKLFSLQESAGSLKLQKTLFVKRFREAAEPAKAITPSKTIGGHLYTSSSSTIIFQIPAIDASDNIINETYDYIAMYRENTDLFIETDADALSQRKDIKQKLANTAVNLIFRYDASTPADASLVNGYLKLEGNNASDEITVSTYLRNKE